MLNKGYFISKLIKSIIITILLIYFFIKTPSNKLIFIPFLICGIASIIKNILLIMEKTKSIKIFDKIFVSGFLLFWFGFLFYSIYYSILNKEYWLLVFSIPFWIVGIKIIKKLVN